MSDPVDPATLRRRAVGGWMEAIGRQGWADVALDDAAAAAGLAPEVLFEHSGDRVDALAGFLAQLETEACTGAAIATGSPRDRLFDGLMRGADHLQAHRAAVLILADSRDPGVVALVAARAPGLVRRLAAAAGVAASGPRGALRQLALAGLLAAAFRTWRTDDSPDMAATMAAIDRLLDRAERAEAEGLSPSLLGFPGFPRFFGERPAPSPAPDPPAE